MKSIFEGLSQITALLGTPVSAETLAAGTVRTDVSGIDFRSVGEFLRSEGFDNHLSRRSPEDIPSLAVPALLLLNAQEAIVVVRIEGPVWQDSIMCFSLEVSVRHFLTMH